MVRAGVSYRNLLIVHGGKGAVSTPPHDIVGQGISPFLPKGGDAGLLLRCMETSRRVFDHHPVNEARTRPAGGQLTGSGRGAVGISLCSPCFPINTGKKAG